MLEGINLIQRYKKNHVRWIGTAPDEIKQKRLLDDYEDDEISDLSEPNKRRLVFAPDNTE